MIMMMMMLMMIMMMMVPSSTCLKVSMSLALRIARRDSCCGITSLLLPDNGIVNMNHDTTTTTTDDDDDDDDIT